MYVSIYIQDNNNWLLSKQIHTHVIDGFFGLSTATFDLQNPSAEGEKDEMISVSGTFITDSLARGCFLVIQCNEDTADIFVAIEREESELTLNESIPVPPSSYIVYAYDLEENTLPYHIPANIPSPEIIINTPCKSLECIF